jgi:peptidoglycan hydrolase CwlO-like protein
MEWFKSKAGQVIALVTIISTLAGFGYAGAGYVNRLENLEKKVGSISSTKSGLQDIEKKFETLDTSIEYINKSIDDGISVSLKTHAEYINSVKAQLSGLSIAVRELEKDVVKLEDGNKNPLAN